MPILRRHQLESYLRDRFGSSVTLTSFGRIGEEGGGLTPKRYGYGAPVRITFRVDGEERRAVLETMKPGPFGHEHPADRAQAMLWDFDSYGRLPRHVRSWDVGAFTRRGTLFSVAPAREFFVLNEWADGRSYHADLDRLTRTGRLLPLDRRRVRALAEYLAGIHRRKRREPDLYRRRWRELIGHGECIMGLTDSYPRRYGFITEDRLRRIEEACNRWRWRLRGRTNRLSQVHGDFHPRNVLFRKGVDFTVLDRSRGEWGEPADDLTAMSINFLFSSLCRWGELRGPFEVLFREYWDRYLTKSGDAGVTETAAPFFAFRGLVVASPVWYPGIAMEVRRTLFRFIENVLSAERFEPEEVKKYLE
jgi:Phosphotransferase enzyme family